jgi:uncharacterized Zn finger protein
VSIALNLGECFAFKGLKTANLLEWKSRPRHHTLVTKRAPKSTSDSGHEHLMEPERLRRLAGEGPFERGARYFEEGRVTNLMAQGDRTTATVQGSLAYRVELRHTPRLLEGSCNCPASDGFEFCKHCVAVALASRAQAEELDALAAGRPQDRILAFLARQPHGMLVEFLMDAASSQSALRDRLLLQADVMTGKIDARYLKKQITAATPMRDIWERHQVVEYFERIETTLAGIRSIASEVPAEDMLTTVLHGFGRLNQALERVDDSGGDRWAAQHDLRELHIQALLRLDLPPEKRAEHLLDLTLQDPADQFVNLLEDYADVLGEQGLAAYFELVQSRLDAMPTLAFGADVEQTYPYLQLAGFLRDRAEAADDVPALIELAKRTCTTGRDYNRIATLYVRLPDLDEALGWLDKADAVSETRGRDLALRVAVHTAREEWLAALAAQRTVFESQASETSYQTLQALAVRAGVAERVQAEAKRFLRGKLQGLPWQREPYAVTLAAILRGDGKTLESFDIIREHVVDPERLLGVMSWFEEQAPSLQGELVARAIEGFIGSKKKRGYRKAVDLLRESRDLFEQMGDQAFDTFVAGLRARHRAKRNLTAMLDALPGRGLNHGPPEALDLFDGGDSPTS